MDQMNFWGDAPVQPKQQSQPKPQPVQQQTQPSTESISFLINTPVNEASSAKHFAAQINHGLMKLVETGHKVDDLYAQLAFEEKKLLQLEQKLSIFINAHNQDMQIIKEGIAALVGENFSEEESTSEDQQFEAEVINQRNYDHDDQLSSPITESRIHGEID